MIKNERQYRITRTQVERFQQALDNLEPPTGPDADLHRQLERSALAGQVDELNQQLREYDDLRFGRVPVGEIEGLDDLPDLLIRARIAAGLSQKDLADRLGIAEQQLQRYEAADWASANLARLVEVARALDVRVSETLLNGVPDRCEPATLVPYLRRAGLDRDFIARRLVPAKEEVGVGAALDMAARVNRIYGWAPSAVLAGSSLELELPRAAGFKVPRGHDAARTHAYAVYAHYLAMLALDTVSTPAAPIPVSATEFATAVRERSGNLGFAAVLSYVWDLGIPVIPLTDSGGFHGVLWRVNHRNAIVLKQQSRTTARWAFDLLHEIGHAIEKPAADEHAVLDDDPSSSEPAEVAANRFAGAVLLDSRQEELTAECVREANGRMERLKSVVPLVARRNHVEVGYLANYVAYRLSLQRENWWGAATNLQQGGPDPWMIARDEFFRRADLQGLNALDRDILAQALSE